VRDWVKRIYRAAKVPEVCAHAMRGLHATLAMEAGQSGDRVARSLGHTSADVTRRSYATAEAVATGRQSAVVREREG
jgi:integrase